jgi:hypothetical protein
VRAALFVADGMLPRGMPSEARATRFGALRVSAATPAMTRLPSEASPLRPIETGVH